MKNLIFLIIMAVVYYPITVAICMFPLEIPKDILFPNFGYFSNVKNLNFRSQYSFTISVMNIDLLNSGKKTYFILIHLYSYKSVI